MRSGRTHSQKSNKKKSSQKEYNKQLALMLGIVVLFFSLYVVGYIRHFDFNPSATIRYSSQVYNESNHITGPGLIIHQWGGYDGQEFFKLAHDLDNSENVVNPNRHLRIGYSFLVAVFSFGQSELFPIVSILLVIASIVFGTYVTSLVLEHFKLNKWWALLYAFTPTFLTNSIHNLAETISASLQITCFYFLLKKKPWHAAAALGLSLFVREDGIIFYFVIAFYYLITKGSLVTRVKRLVPFILSGLPWLTWWIILSVKYGHMISGKDNFNPPIVGMIQGIIEMSSHHASRFGAISIFRSPLHLFVTTYSSIILMIFLVACVIFATYRYFKHPTLISHLFFFYSLYTLTIGRNIWITSISGPIRIVYMTFPLLLFSYAERPNKYVKLMLLYWVGMTFVIFVGQQVFPFIGPYFVS